MNDLVADRIETAARWLAEHWDSADQPYTKTLHEGFGLEFSEAVKAIVTAKRIRADIDTLRGR